jgi:alkanesulfonate monooxygenase SsuD/methylene tetrahydromethanopterin reductase-like flavin-dependent oxidoreductase (luciferase family)
VPLGNRRSCPIISKSSAVALNLLFHMHHESEAVRDTPRAYAETMALIRQADELAIDCVWLAEHHLSPTRGRLPSPLLFAVAAARETRRLRLGPCVLLVPLHGPVDLAEQIATADLLTDGRLVAGLGSGGNPEEFAAYGVSLEERRTRFAEGLEVITGALGGGAFSYAGRFYHVPEITLVPAPLQPVNHLIWVAAGSLDSARLAGRSGGNLLLARGTPLADLRAQITAYQEARAEQDVHPETARIQVTRGVYVARTDEQAWREAEQGIVEYLRASRRDVPNDNLQDLAQRGDFIIGSPRTCAAAIRALTKAVPITDLACDIALYGMEHARTAQSLDLLGREVAELLCAE